MALFSFATAIRVRRLLVRPTQIKRPGFSRRNVASLIARDSASVHAERVTVKRRNAY